MARIKSKRSALQTLSCKFGGMAQHTPLSPMGAEDVCNFRILPDGSLRVRSGYTLKKQFSSGKKVRGFWEGTVGRTSLCFAVVGDKVYRLSGDEMDETAVGTVYDGDNNVHFFVYKDVLYLLDGQNIRMYSPSSGKFTVAEPYVPLYGFSWSPEYFGDVYEEINLLTPRLRMHYFNPNASNVFVLPYYAEAIDTVRANGIKTTSYTFSPGSNQIIVETKPTYLEVSFTVSLNTELRAQMMAAQMSYIYSRNGEEKLFLGDSQGRLFCSRDATNLMLSSCHVMYPKATQLYFCMEDILFLGDSAHPVSTICPLYETLLVFTSDRIWSIAYQKKKEEEILLLTPASHEIGCSSPQGVMIDTDSILVATKDGLYRISASPARPEDLFFERLSIGIDDKFPLGFTDNVILMRNYASGEIWMRDPSNTDGEIWVWNTEVKDWYRFEGINTSLFFKHNEGIGFAQGSNLFLFDRFCNTDNGAPIAAHYKSAYLDFGSPESPRRSMRAFLYSSPKANCQVLFETEREERTYRLIAASNAKVPCVDDMRIGTHRYRFLRFTLSVSATTPTEFYRLDIYSKP